MATPQPETHSAYPGRKQIRHLLARYDALTEQRLTRIRQSLNHEQETLFSLLPFLLHINHPALPGFVDEHTPAGIAGYIPDREAVLLAKRYSSEVRAEQRPQRVLPIKALYLIGSSGTLGHERQSDFDLWVCYHPSLSEDQLSALNKKLQSIEKHAEHIGLEVHFFLMHDTGFRDGEHIALSSESSGSTQRHLLLEEFYRTGLRLAGQAPLWWLIPLEQQHNYTAWVDHLLAHRFVDANEWLDFGGLEHASAREFFTAAHWQLYKGIELPYKSLLKLLLFESYTASYPKVAWLCDETKRHLHGEAAVDPDLVDGYRLILQRIETHLKATDDEKRLALARRAFYFKSGLRLSQHERTSDWKHLRMRKLTEHWGWHEGDLINLDARRHWKLDRVAEERSLLIEELTQSYRMLTEFGQKHADVPSADHPELSVLGRKLYAALERRPGKIDRINPGISRDLSEDTVWLRRQDQAWHLYLQSPEHYAQVKHATSSLVEMLIWLSVNGLLSGISRIDLEQTQGGAHPDTHLKLLKLFRARLPLIDRHNRPMQDFLQPAHGEHTLCIINAETDPTGSQVQLVQDADDPLNLGPQQRSLLREIDLLISNSWGEIQVEKYRDPDMLPAMLCSLLELGGGAPEETHLECFCDTVSYGKPLSQRLNQLVADCRQHFANNKGYSRYLYRTGGRFQMIEGRNNQFDYVDLGSQRELLAFLAKPKNEFCATDCDPKALPGSPLPFLLRLNRANTVQVCYRIQKGGISLFIFDEQGNLHEQWLAGAEESFFLEQQQRFFDTLQAWRPRIAANGAANVFRVQFLRISYEDGHWKANPPGKLPRPGQRHIELFLSTGRRGPVKDGFSLISGSQEFNSAMLGDNLYEQVARFIVSQRSSGDHYPIYLTGVLIADEQRRAPIPLVELLRQKARIERRLASAVV